MPDGVRLFPLMMSYSCYSSDADEVSLDWSFMMDMLFFHICVLCCYLLCVACACTFLTSFCSFCWCGSILDIG